MRSRLILSLLLTLLLAGCGAPVRVTWKTETEMNTAGFNLYRGLSPDGPFDVKVNTELIPPSSEPLTGKEYTYLDATAQGGATYYYQLQEVERNGTVNTFGPISVRAGGLQWPHAVLLGALAGLVLLIWVRGGQARSRQARPPARPPAEQEAGSVDGS